MDHDFVDRLSKAFDNASMAEVARRLKIPHATVRNYYKTGRLPAPEVLIKIAAETGVSLNWLLIGTGEMYAGAVRPLDLGRILEQKIGDIIDERLAGHRPETSIEFEDAAVREDFDIDAAIVELDEPERILHEWFRHEGRQAPHDLGLAFFRGWDSFSADDKAAAIRDAKKLLDRILDLS